MITALQALGTSPTGRQTHNESLVSQKGSFQGPCTDMWTQMSDGCNAVNSDWKWSKIRFSPFTQFSTKPTALVATPWGLTETWLRTVYPHNTSLQCLCTPPQPTTPCYMKTSSRFRVHTDKTPISCINDHWSWTEEEK